MYHNWWSTDSNIAGVKKFIGRPIIKYDHRLFLEKKPHSLEENIKNGTGDKSVRVSWVFLYIFLSWRDPGFRQEGS